jgi:hypothetical protein
MPVAWNLNESCLFVFLPQSKQDLSQLEVHFRVQVNRRLWGHPVTETWPRIERSALVKAPGVEAINGAISGEGRIEGLSPRDQVLQVASAEWNQLALWAQQELPIRVVVCGHNRHADYRLGACAAHELQRPLNVRSRAQWRCRLKQDRDLGIITRVGPQLV